MKKIELIAVLLLALSFSACRQEGTSFMEEIQKLAGQEFPAFEMKDLEGNIFRWSDMQGKVVFVNFWFTKCAPCIKEIPLLNQMRRDFAGEDVVFLAISPDDSLTIAQFLEKNDFDFIQIPDAKSYIQPFFGDIYPLNVFVDRSGIIHHALGPIPIKFDRKHPSGFLDDREFRRRLGALLRELHLQKKTGDTEQTLRESCSVPPVEKL